MSGEMEKTEKKLATRRGSAARLAEKVEGADLNIEYSAGPRPNFISVELLPKFAEPRLK